jgi:hypothetical protein
MYIARSPFIIASLSAILLSACTATGPTFQPADNTTTPGNGMLYVYREKTFAFGGRSAYFYVNDVNVFDLNPEGYSWVSLPPGTYKLKQKWPVDVSFGSLEISIQIQPGEARYVSFATGGCKVYPMCVEWRLAGENQRVGAQEISAKKFQPNFGAEKINIKLNDVSSKAR